MEKKLEFFVEGMDCPSCAGKIENAVKALPGIRETRVNYSRSHLELISLDQVESADAVTKAVRKLGYGISKKVEGKAGEEKKSWYRTAKGKQVLLAGSALAGAGILSLILPATGQIPFALAALIPLLPFVRKAWAGALVKQPFTIETLVSLAVVGAVLIGESLEAGVVVFLFSIGELLESVAAAKARRGVEALAAFMPKVAQLVTDGGTVEVPATDLVPGQVVEIRPGSRVPADGIILAGESSVDESPITGESVPVDKMPGDNLYAGSINADGLIRLEVTRSASDNMIARILQMVEEAEASKSPTARFIDRFSRYYTPAVILVSAAVVVLPPLLGGGSWEEWTYKGLAILLIGCPCALVLSTPAAITSGIATGARHGLLVKGGAALETIGRVKFMAFDKTGTLTAGTPRVTDVVVFDAGAKRIISLAAAVEAGSSHPLALAIGQEAESRGLELLPTTDHQAQRGRGAWALVDGVKVTVASPRHARTLANIPLDMNEKIEELESLGKTVVVVLEGSLPLGLMALRDELRADSKTSMAVLRQLKVRPIMLTGDNARAAAALANELKIEFKAELLPDDKLQWIKDLADDGQAPVGMVGDGINDAPALAQADVGISMGGGTDVALEAADAALLHERVGDVPALIRLSRATMANIHQNIGLALGLKAVFLVTTLLGVTSLWMAILADTGATVLVTINALRLLSFNPNAIEPLQSMRKRLP